MLVAALATVTTYITPEVEEKAVRKASDWFGEKEGDNSSAGESDDD